MGLEVDRVEQNGPDVWTDLCEYLGNLALGFFIVPIIDLDDPRACLRKRAGQAKLRTRSDQLFTFSFVDAEIFAGPAWAIVDGPRNTAKSPYARLEAEAAYKVDGFVSIDDEEEVAPTPITCGEGVAVRLSWASMYCWSSVLTVCQSSFNSAATSLIVADRQRWPT